MLSTCDCSKHSSRTLACKATYEQHDQIFFYGSELDCPQHTVNKYTGNGQYLHIWTKLYSCSIFSYINLIWSIHAFDQPFIFLYILLLTVSNFAIRTGIQKLPFTWLIEGASAWEKKHIQHLINQCSREYALEIPIHIMNLVTKPVRSLPINLNKRLPHNLSQRLKQLRDIHMIIK